MICSFFGFNKSPAPEFSFHASTLNSGSFTSGHFWILPSATNFVSTSFGSKSLKSMLANDCATCSSRGFPSSPTRFQFELLVRLMCHSSVTGYCRRSGSDEASVKPCARA